MKKLFILLLLVVTVAFLSCLIDPDRKREKVTQPAMPQGDSYADIDESKTYTTGGSESSRGHAVEYRLDLDADGARQMTAWSEFDTVSASWPDSGLYVVKAQARCAIHKHVLSKWSEGKLVAVALDLAEPEMRFATRIDGVQTPYDPAAPLDTVGMFMPFDISYHGLSANGPIEAYKFFPLTTGVTMPGQNEWTTDLSDTLRAFPNTGDDALPSGVFRLAAQCRDVLGAESAVDAGTFSEGVTQVVVNFDPDTWFTGVVSSYTVDDVIYEEAIDFADGTPDTVPMNSWVRIDYVGSDDPRDGSSCDPLDPNECIGFQVAYERDSERINGAYERSTWLPRTGLHDTDPFSAADSNSFSIGSYEYNLYARTVDENGRPDGTPPHVEIVGNHDPTMDRLSVEDHLGNQVDLSILDTVTWNFWKGEGWPYSCLCDTVDYPEAFCGGQPNDPPGCAFRDYPDNAGSFDYYKSFGIRINALGHDHPKDPTGSGVKSWRYYVMNSSGQFLCLGKACAGWFDGAEINFLNDVISWKVYYPGPFTPNPDPNGDTVFANLPTWLNEDLTFFVMGRDTEFAEPEFEQFIFINGDKQLFNVTPAASLGRWTEEKVFSFRITLVR